MARVVDALAYRVVGIDQLIFEGLLCLQFACVEDLVYLLAQGVVDGRR